MRKPQPPDHMDVFIGACIIATMTAIFIFGLFKILGGK